MPGGHDDICNAVAGLANINNRYSGFDVTWYPAFLARF
jgi:hypothetical protein